MLSNKMKSDLPVAIAIALRGFNVDLTSTSLEQNPRIRYPLLLKTGSLDNAIQEFSLAQPSWSTRH